MPNVTDTGCRAVRGHLVVLTVMLAMSPIGLAQYPSGSQVRKDGTAIVLEDYVSLPVLAGTMRPDLEDIEELRLHRGRAHALLSEPRDAAQSAGRFIVVEQKGVLYFLDRRTRAFTAYIDFTKVFDKFANLGSYAAGLVSVAFDPAYARNGRFYTVHTEQAGLPGSAAAGNASLPGLSLEGFTPTAAMNPPVGGVQGYESVIVEWTDSNIQNSSFEGTAREVLRLGLTLAFHPMGDVLFNPSARAGDTDYGNLYVGMGDGTAGERPGPAQNVPQRLDALQGKILRITPDITLRPTDAKSSNGRYRIPSDNPFVSVKGARGEIYATGFRNQDRMTWDPPTSTFIASDIGAANWEEVNIIVRGGNYGFPEREGPEQRFLGGPNNGRSAGRLTPPVPHPSPDTLIVEGLDRPVTPAYPVAAYSHEDGNAIGGGFVYRGTLLPQLRGKYVFSEITSGRLFYADLAEMLAAMPAPRKMATIHELQVVYKGQPRRMFDIVAGAYAQMGGRVTPKSVLPGNSGLTVAGRPDPYGVPYAGGRADVRFSIDGDGELYVLSKTDGVIRRVTAALGASARPFRF